MRCVLDAAPRDPGLRQGARLGYREWESAWHVDAAHFPIACGRDVTVSDQVCFTTPADALPGGRAGDEAREVSVVAGVVARTAVEIWLIDRRTPKRIRRLTLAEVLALRALKRDPADAEEEALCRPLLDGARKNKLWFECRCRQVGSARPDFHGRHLGNGRYLQPRVPASGFLFTDPAV